jgi:hypothetical protein
MPQPAEIATGKIPCKIPMFPTPDVRGFSNEGAIAKLSKVAESWEEFSGMAHRKSQSQKRKHWPTPRATDGSKGGRTEEGAKKELARGKNVDLGVAVKMWPTPRAFTHKDSTTDRGKSNLGEVVGGQLNPMWVEWLMGFPLGWTDLEDSETQ